MAVLPDPATRPEKSPYIESAALKKKLEGVIVTASNYPQGKAVEVGFVGPDFEVKKATYPGIYISYGPMERAPEREHRGRIPLAYAPPGYDDDVQVPDGNGGEVSWRDVGLNRAVSPYTVNDVPIPYNLDFNVTVLSRNYQQLFEIMSQLDEAEYLPSRFGGLEVPQDGTIRTLELLGGPRPALIKDEDGKRVAQAVYTVRVAAEILFYDVESVNRITDVDVQFTSTVHEL